MNRNKHIGRGSYRDQFGSENRVFVVIHVEDDDQALRNMERAVSAEVDGVFLIQHGITKVTPGIGDPDLNRLARRIRRELRDDHLWLGVNYLGSVPPERTFDAANVVFHALWTDTTLAANGPGGEEVAFSLAATQRHGPFPLYFGGLEFKGQPKAEDLKAAVTRAVSLTDVIVTSGPATGKPASREKLAKLRELVGTHPLATASGVTPENAAEQFKFVDTVLVATGINVPGDFYNIDPDRLARLVDVARSKEPSAA